ncbi:MAG: sigma-70 family RNA polymerase sigma factor [Bacteroidales bacterium]|nr:sigma-70 family RNA polymerase sigma factor [Bacteroidales bacterium]
MTEQEYIQYVERCRPRLVELARIYVVEPDDAEDIVQDVLVKLWTIHNTIPSFEAIAFAATKNKAIDFLRRRQRHQGSYIDIETLNAELEQVDDTDDATNREAQINQMLNAIEHLPSQQSLILRMRHLKGMEMADIAKVTGSTEVSIRKTLSRARLSLAKWLSASVAAVLILFAGFSAFNHYSTSRMLSIYEGSYVIVDGQRIDDLSLIHDDIVATLAFAQQTEDNIYSQSDIIDAQDDALNSITDEVERERIKQLLADIY